MAISYPPIEVKEVAASSNDTATKSGFNPPPVADVVKPPPPPLPPPPPPTPSTDSQAQPQPGSTSWQQVASNK